MLIHISFALKQVSVDGVSVICSPEEAKRIKDKYSSAKIRNLRRNSKKKNPHGPVISIPVEQYAAGN